MNDTKIQWHSEFVAAMNLEFAQNRADLIFEKEYNLNTVDEIKADDVTVSIMREARPDGLFQYLEEHGYSMSNPYKGIYYIEGKVLFPTQTVITMELDEESHIWLKALSKSLDK